MRWMLAVGAGAWLVTGLVFSEALDEKQREYTIIHGEYADALRRLGESEQKLRDAHEDLRLCEAQRHARTDVWGALSGEEQ